MHSVERRVYSVESKVWSVKCTVWSVECTVWSLKCQVWGVKCTVWSVKCRVWSGECHHVAQPWHCDSPKIRSPTRWKRCACHTKWRSEVSKVLRLPRKMQRIFWKTWQKYCACRTKQFLTRHERWWSVTKCHACHAPTKTSEKISKSDPFCRTYHKHGHSDLARTLANGCERLRTVADGCGRLGNVWRTQLNPQTSRVKREPLLRIREQKQKLNNLKLQNSVNSLAKTNPLPCGLRTS